MNKVKKIIIADDHALVRIGLTTLIGSFKGYEVVADATDGEQLVNQVITQKLEPDIALLDIGMPKMDGYATAQWIKTNLPDTKILALSTMESEQAIIKMIRNGAKGYVLKDAEPKELKLAMEGVMSIGFYYNDVVSRKLMKSIHQFADEDSEINILLKLNERELQFLKLVCSEKSYHEIAAEMCVSSRTIDGYRDNLFKKLNVSSRVGLVLYAIRNEIVKI